MLCKNNLNVTFTSPSSKYDDVEFIVADLNTNKSLSKMRIMCVYISPNTASNSANVENFCNILYNYVCVNFPVFIIGDFNMPTIDWFIPATFARKNQQVLLKFCTDNALKQLISEPTHCNDNIFNLLLCNTIGNKYLNSHCVDAPMSNSCDHYSIHFSIIWPST